MEAQAIERPERLVGGHHELGGLLCLILVSLVIQLAVPDTHVSRLVIVLLQGATLIVALKVSGVRKQIVEFAAAVVGIAAVTAVVSLIGGDDISASSTRIVTLLLVALAPVAIAVGLRRDIAQTGTVTMRTMFGVLCIYLLIGMLFAILFNVVQSLADEAFFASGKDGNVSDFLYFSFTTLTTTGYGDFVAGTSLGRSLTILEALIGQIYLVTVVALIVANIRPGGRTA